MHSNKPLFRADHVGSFLRTEKIKEARKRYFEENSISQNDMICIENDEIN